MRLRHLTLTFLAGLFLTTTPALADPALGQWLTEADKKGQVAHVQVTQCGAALCGKITKIYDPSGNAISHPNIGKRVFWDMKPIGGGKYEGTAFVPAHNKQYVGQMKLSGNLLKVGGCVGPVCLNQRWSRVQ